jgi:hypothetical protein
VYTQPALPTQYRTFNVTIPSGSATGNTRALLGNSFITVVTSSLTNVNLLNDAGSGFTATTSSLNSGSYSPIAICTDIPQQTFVNTDVLLSNTRPAKISIYDATNFEVVSSGWIGQANYVGPWGSSLNTELTSSLSFGYSILLAPYYYDIQYGNANLSDIKNSSVYVALTCDTSATASVSVLPLQLSVTSSCAFGGSNGTITANIFGGVAPYYYSLDSGSSYTSPTSATTYTWSSLSDADFNVVVKDSSANIQYTYWPVIYCNTRRVSVEFVRVDPLATGTVVDRGTSYTDTFAVSSYVGVNLALTASATNASLFEGWNSEADSSTIISTNARYTYAVQNAATQSFYAIFSKAGSPTTGSFCYFDQNPIGQALCNSCDVSATIYFNSASINVNSLDSASWYTNSELTIPANGFYKFNSGNTNNAIVYQVTNGTGSALGPCDTTAINC